MFKLEIITPEKMVFSDSVSLVTVPSSHGTLGILSKHADLFALLTHGEIKVKQGEKLTYFSIGSGYIKVGKEKTIVLVSKAIDAEELDEAAISAARARAEDLLTHPPADMDIASIQSALRQSISDLNILKKRKTHHL